MTLKEYLNFVKAKIAEQTKKTIGCNLCTATRKASRAGKLKEDSECLVCMTSYKKSKGKV